MSDIVAQVIVAEIGTEMGASPTAGHLVSRAGLCPRMDQGARKRRSTRVRHLEELGLKAKAEAAA